VAAVGVLVVAAGCPRSVPLDYSAVKSKVAGQIAMAGQFADYDVDFDASSLVALVLPDPKAEGFICSMMSHSHAIQAMLFDSEFKIDPATPTDSWIKITVPGLALHPDDEKLMKRFDETKEREGVSDGDRKGIKGTAFNQLKIDDYPDLVFEVKAPPAVEGIEEKATITAKMAGVEEGIPVTYTAAFEDSTYVINLTGTIDSEKFGMFQEGLGMDCVDKAVPLNVTLVLRPKG
jgi:polyisoprenoid-binding protein YceI